MTIGLGAPAADPLEGWERPAGDPVGINALGQRCSASAAALTASARHLMSTVRQVLGQAWTGAAAAACGASCMRSAQVLLVAADAYETAGAALSAHGVRLDAAQAEYDAARHLSDEALAEEQAHREAAGAALLEELAWRSPLREMARARAEQAVTDAAGSARQTARVLEETLAPLLANRPQPETGDDSFLSGVVHSLEAQAWGFVRPAFQGAADISYGESLKNYGSPTAPEFTFAVEGDPHSLDRESLLDVFEQVRSGHWAYGLGYGVGFLLPDLGSAAAPGAAAAGVRSALIARRLPQALKDIEILVVETPEGVRLPAGVDATRLKQLWAETFDPPGGGVPGSPGDGGAGTPAGIDAKTAAEMIKDARPVGSAMKSDAAHRAASFAVDEVARDGRVFKIRGRDGVERLLVQVPGELNGVPGRFEWILDGDELTHQMFVRGGTINGKAIKP